MGSGTVVERRLRRIEVHSDALSLSVEHGVSQDGVSNIQQRPPTCGRVLLVEDDPVIVDLLSEVLISAGYQVMVARNAEDGVRLFESGASETFCIVLDYEIPGMHPERLLERFQQLNPAVKIILSSGYPQSFIARDFPLDRVSGYLSKPYDPQLLLQALLKVSGSELGLE